MSDFTTKEVDTTVWKPKPKQTNADRIRSKSDKELADMMGILGGCPLNAMTNCPKGHAPNDDCNADRCWLDWLKQEVSG